MPAVVGEVTNVPRHETTVHELCAGSKDAGIDRRSRFPKPFRIALTSDLDARLQLT
jgi:hypothetical protein